MKKILDFLGCNNELDKDQYAVYIINSLAILILSSYIFLDYFLLNAKQLILPTLFFIFMFILVFIPLKHKKYFLAKNILFIVLITDIFLSSFYFFGLKSGVHQTLFTIPPATFIAYNLHIKRERIMLVVFNIVTTILIIIIQIIGIKPVVQLTENTQFFMNISSMLLTLGIIFFVFHYYFKNLTVILNKLKTTAQTDPLTGISNRRSFFDVGRVNFANNGNKNFSLIIFDVDYFKNINDEYGHPVGDIVLVQLVELILRNIRSGDLFARIGGEEFALILENIKENNALEVAHKIRSVVEHTPFSINKDLSINTTISVGLVHYNSDFKSFDEMIIKADKALYRAKQKGKNRVEVSK